MSSSSSSSSSTTSGSASFSCTFTYDEQTSASMFQDPFKQFGYMKKIAQECIEIISTCVSHIEQFPTSVLDVRSVHARMKECWLIHWGDMNCEMSNADSFSFSDLLFVTLCYLDLAANPSWRICADSDQSMDAVLAMVRYVGCQHTPETMNTWVEPQFYQRLKQNVVWLVCCKLSSNMTGWAEEQKNKEALIKQKKWTKKADTLSWVSADIYVRNKTLTSFAEPVITTDGTSLREQELGEYFTNSSVSGIILKVCNRICHGIEMEDYLFSLYRVVDEKPDLGEPIIKEQMYTWLHRICSIDSSDNFAHDFRTAVFDACLPINSCLDAKSRKGATAKVIPLTQLQNELGFEVASHISESFGLRVRSVGFEENKKHPYYQIMMLYMFGYTCYHEQRLPFIKKFYIPQTQLMESLSLLATKKKFHRNREPLIVRLQRKWVIHYIDSVTQEALWLPCADAIEACLFWVFLLKKHHDSKLIDMFDLTEWVDTFLSKRNFLLEDD